MENARRAPVWANLFFSWLLCGVCDHVTSLCSLYLLFGIAMIAMSFNLLQEEVINSVKSLGKMCGIIKDNEEEEEY